LVRKGKKGKGKKSQTKPESSQGGKKNDFSKNKCLHCHNYGHYDMKCLERKVSKMTLGGAAGEALASHFNLDFTLIACMSNTMMGNVWHLDLGAFFHMTGCRGFFSDLEEKDLYMHIKLRDDKRYNMTGIVTVTFQRDSGSPLKLKD